MMIRRTIIENAEPPRFGKRLNFSVEFLEALPNPDCEINARSLCSFI